MKDIRTEESTSKPAMQDLVEVEASLRRAHPKSRWTRNRLADGGSHRPVTSNPGRGNDYFHRNNEIDYVIISQTKRPVRSRPERCLFFFELVGPFACLTRSGGP